MPRAFTLKVLSDVLEFDFLAIANGKKVNNSKLIWFKVILWHIKDLFNLKTNTMKKASILSVMIIAICFGLFILINDSQAQNSKKLDYSKYLETGNRGIIYFFPRGTLSMVSNAKDTADFKIKKGIIQEYNNNIYLNGRFIGKALKSDTVIYDNEKVTIRPSFWEFKSSYGQDIYYYIPKGTSIDNVAVNIDTEYLYIGKYQIKEYNYQIFLNGVFQGQAEHGSSVIFKGGVIEILK
jgi:hypothetical protein